MIKFIRHPANPIISPQPANPWEEKAAFNGSIVRDKNIFHLLYRAMSNNNLSTIGHAKSSDGLRFSQRQQLIVPEHDWEAFGCEDPRVTKFNGRFFVFYTALSTYPFVPEGIKIGVAVTRDFNTIDEKHLVTDFNAKAMALFPERINGQIVGILSVDTDQPPAKIALAFFNQPEDIWSKEFWQNWKANLNHWIIPLLRDSKDQVEVGAPPLKTNQGWLLIYAYIKGYLTPNRTLGIEAALVNLNNPQKIIGRTKDPLLIPEADYELNGQVPKVVFPSGALVQDDKLFVYYGAADTTTCLASCSLDELLKELAPTKPAGFIPSKTNKLLKRFSGNPIIKPILETPWQAKAVFNPAAIYEGGQVHLVYRAMSKDNTSSLGYAVSSDGLNFKQRSPDPIYIPREKFEQKLKPGGNSGCEDPRITKIDDRLFMCYTAFDGVHLPRVALTSIKLDDFLNHNWNWTKPYLISPPDVMDKNACLLPEKINNQYVFLHRVDRCICINYVDDLQFGEKDWLKQNTLIHPRDNQWDNRKVGISAPPLKTQDGWLLLYHGVSAPKRVYRVGAVLLSSNDPTQVIGRTDKPLLEPETEYELKGYVPNVVFPCGAVIIKNQLFVYYGGADKVIGVATANLNDVLKEIKKT